MKIKKILERLLQLHPKSIDLSLNRIKRLLKDLNNPEKKISNVIQVVGTNGKFSVCTSLREIFETAGYSVNMNISPSLRRFNERYYFSGKHISDDELYDLLKYNGHRNKLENNDIICSNCFGMLWKVMLAVGINPGFTTTCSIHSKIRMENGPKYIGGKKLGYGPKVPVRKPLSFLQ